VVEGQEQRTIHEVKLYELGPVVFPAYADAIAGVRSPRRRRRWTPDERKSYMGRVKRDRDMRRIRSS
jgi:phage head maturation protease